MVRTKSNCCLNLKPRVKSVFFNFIEIEWNRMKLLVSGLFGSTLLVGFTHVLYRFVHSYCYVAFHCTNSLQTIYIPLLTDIQGFFQFLVIKICCYVNFHSSIHYYCVSTKQLELLFIRMFTLTGYCQKSCPNSHSHQHFESSLPHTCQHSSCHFFFFLHFSLVTGI